MNKQWYWAGLMLLFVLPLTVWADDDEKEEGKPVFLSLDAGLAVGGQFTEHGYTDQTMKQVHLTAQLPFSDQVTYGIGTGFEKNSGMTLIPLFLHFKGMFDDEGRGPFIQSQLGYAIAGSYEKKYLPNLEIPGGMLFAFGAGYQFETEGKTAFTVQASYRHQFLVEKYDRYEQEINFDMLSIKVGVFF